MVHVGADPCKATRTRVPRRAQASREARLTTAAKAAWLAAGYDSVTASEGPLADGELERAGSWAAGVCAKLGGAKEDPAILAQ
jgi:hypothetical protein